MANAPPAHKLLFENEMTRVWEMILEPGEAYPIHDHEYPYLSLILEGASLVLIGEDGGEEAIEVGAGDVIWRNLPDIHGVRNVGKTRFRNRLAEFKS